MTDLINLAYLLAAALFIVGLKRLQSPATARRGNQLAALGMLVAVVATLFLGDILSPIEMIGGLAVGGLVGLLLARRVPMTSMPELVAAFNGFGGLASALVAGAEVFGDTTWSATLTITISVLIGMVTFSGSFVAFGKLSGRISGNPVSFPGSACGVWILHVSGPSGNGLGDGIAVINSIGARAGPIRRGRAGHCRPGDWDPVRDSRLGARTCRWLWRS